MKITNLALENFRSHESTSIELHPGAVDVITGACGTGKTSIAGAIEYAISGRCQWTDERGLNGDLQRNDSKNPGQVLLTIIPKTESSPVTIARNTQNKVSLSTANRISQKDAQSEIDRLIDCPSERARICLRGSRFFHLHQKERKEFFSDLLEIKITEEMVLDALLSKQIENPDAPIYDCAKSISGKSGMTDFSRIYDAAFDSRAALNKSILDGQRLVREEEAELEKMQAGTQAEIEAFEAEMLEAQDELNANKMAKAVNDEINGQIQKIQRELSLLGSCSPQSPPPPHESQVPALDAELEAVAGKREAATKRQHALFCKNQEANRLSDDISKTQARLNMLAEKSKTESDRLNRAKSTPPDCVNCPGEKCSSWSEESLEKLRESIKTMNYEFGRLSGEIIPKQEAFEEMESLLSLLDSEAEIEDELRELQGQIIDLRKKRQSALEADNRHRMLLKEYEKHESIPERTKILSENVNALSVRLKPALTENEISYLNQIVDRCKEDIRKIRSYLDLHAKIAKYNAALAEKTIRREGMIKVLAFFAPDGYQAEVARKALEPFLSSINSILSAFGFSIDYTETLDMKREFINYSAGEQVMISFAHQVVFAQKTGLKVIIVDQIDSLDDVSQANFFKIAKSYCVDFDHIIVVGVRAVGKTTAPSIYFRKLG